MALFEVASAEWGFASLLNRSGRAKRACVRQKFGLSHQRESPKTTSELHPPVVVDVTST